jgi:hypothetical protein
MPRIATAMTVELDDGRTLNCTVDQRDWARLEAADIPDRARQTRVRFLAWSALKRGKQYTGPWDEFNDTDCVEASDIPPAEEPTGDDEGLDPGQTVPSDGT